MNLVFIVYLLGLVEKLNHSLQVVFVVSIVSTGICLLIKGIDYEDLSKDTHKTYNDWTKRFISIALVSGTLFTFVPTKEMAYTMLAAYGVEEIVTNERVQELGGKSLDVIEKALDEFLQEEETSD